MARTAKQVQRSRSPVTSERVAVEALAARQQPEAPEVLEAWEPAEAEAVARSTGSTQERAAQAVTAL